MIKFDDEKWEIFNEGNSLLTTSIINSISVDKNNIWLGTDDGLYSISSEWRKYDTNNSPLNSNKINDVFVSKDNSVWVTTNQKSIYRFLNIIDTPNYISKNYKIFQNYHNPFNLSTTIEYSIPIQDIINITV